MGVVKNLMVRFGADVSSLIRNMKTAETSTANATSGIKKATSGMRKTVKESFSNSRMSVREYSAYVAKTKQDHTVATQSAERLSDKIRQMQSVYQTVKAATAGLDLTKPLEEMIADAEKNLVKIESKARKVEKELAFLSNVSVRGSPKRIEKLQEELGTLSQKSQNAEHWLELLNQVADRIGTQNIRFASDAGLKNLAADIQRMKNELNATQVHATKVGERLRNMGIAPTLKYVLKNIGNDAARAASGGVKRLGTAMKTLGGSILKRIGAIPGRLLHIGKSAASGAGGLNRMVRSIRNIGIVSLGIRVASGMFGQLRSIISNYISQNEALNASVATMKNQLGQALAPAINMVIATMQRLMPVVTSVSNAINAVFTTLFGNVKATTAAAGQAASTLDTYGFDQITKESDDSNNSGAATSGQMGEQSALVLKLTGWIEQLKAAFVAGDWKSLGQIVGEGINSVADSINAVDVGTKAGKFADNLFTTLHSALSTINFSGIGTKLGQMFTSNLETVDWTNAGETVGMAMTALPSTVAGFITGTNWSVVGQSLGQMLSGALSSVGRWIQSVDWLKIGDCIWKFVSNIDYGAIAKGLFSSIGSALGAGVGVLWGFISGAVTTIKEYFSKKIEEAGGNIAEGMLKGIGDRLLNIGTWIVDNVFTPFIEGFKEAFGIHSPSTVMQELGGFLAQGALNGFAEQWQALITFLSEGLGTIKRKFQEGWNKCRTETATKWIAISGTVKEKWQLVTTSLAEGFTTIKQKFQEGWANCKTETDIKWAEISSTVAEKRKRLTSDLAEGFTTIKQKFQEGWNNCKTETASLWDNITKTVSEKLTDMQAKVAEKFKDIRQPIMDFWNDLKTSIPKVAANVANDTVVAFQKIKTGIVNVFSELWSGIKGWINKIIGGVESMLKFIIQGINNMISAFNKIAAVGKDVGLDLSIQKIATVTLPRLATGGVADGPTTAIIGEAGKEVVLPLERNTGWMTTLAQQLVELGGGNCAPLTLQFFLGGRKITEYVIKDINQITKTMGVCPIHV